MPNEFTEEDDALLAALGVEMAAKEVPPHTPREERIIAGFEDIQRFVGSHGRLPRHDADAEIFERLHAIRLDRLRALDDCQALLAPLDHQKLLNVQSAETGTLAGPMDDDALLAALGVDAQADDLASLRHVRSTAEKRAAEEVAVRTPCRDFARYRPLFDKVQHDLETGLRQTRRFERKSEIAPGRFYVLEGQKVFVASMEQPEVNEHGNLDARLRVIYDNGTERNLLMRSLQRALQQDDSGRRISEPVAGPLFADDQGGADNEASGTIYVLRSKSDDPRLTAHQGVLHKIGVTGGDLARRLANAPNDPTFLLADVEVVASYDLFNIDRTRLENLIHRIFAPARLEIEIRDRFGKPVVPREWFLVPLFAIDEAVERIRDGSVVDFLYDPAQARLVRASDHSDSTRV